MRDDCPINLPLPLMSLMFILKNTLHTGECAKCKCKNHTHYININNISVMICMCAYRVGVCVCDLNLTPLDTGHPGKEMPEQTKHCNSNMRKAHRATANKCPLSGLNTHTSQHNTSKETHRSPLGTIRLSSHKPGGTLRHQNVCYPL